MTTGKLSRRHFLQSSALVAGGTLLAACAAVPGESGAAAADEGASMSEEPVELVAQYWATRPEFIEDREILAQRMTEKFPNVTASQSSVPGGQYGEKVLTAIAAGTPPDTMQLNHKWEPFFRGQNALLDVVPFANADDEFTFDVFYPRIIELGTHEGELFTVPRGWNPFVIYYNRALFGEAGLDDLPTSWENDTWTWDSFLETAQALTTDTDGDGRTDQYGMFFPYWYPFLRLGGGDVLSDDQQSSGLESAEALAALQWLADLRLTHHVSPSPAEIEGLGGPQDLFTAGRVAMFTAGAWGIGALTRVEGLDWDVGPLPRAAGQPPVGYTQYYGHGIPKGTQSAEWSWEYLKVISDEESNITVAQTIGDVPAMSHVAEGDAFAGLPKPPTRQVFIDSAPHMQVWPTLAPITEIMDRVITPELNLSFLGEKSVEDAVAAAGPKVDEILAEFWGN